MVSERTKDCKKKRNIFYAISTILWIGTAIFYVLAAINMGLSKTNADSGLGTYILSMSMTLLIAIVLTIIIKDKVRNTIWMACVVLSSILYKETGMYITFALWAIDEFILYAIYKKYKNRVEINKEIDLRGE